MENVKQEEFAMVTVEQLKAKYPHLSNEDINFMVVREKILTDDGSIGIHKYNELVAKDTANRIYNAAYPDKDPRVLTSLEKKQMVQFETDKVIRQQEQETREKEYLKNVRDPSQKIIETTTGIALNKKTLYAGFKEAFRLLEGHDFNETAETINNIEPIIKYFSRDESFFGCKALLKSLDGVELSPGFNKGILIVGNYGNGKSTIMKCIEIVINHNFKIASENNWDTLPDWKAARFKVVNCHDLVTEFEGLTTQEEKNAFIKNYSRFRFSFDDLKKEPEASNYGKKQLIRGLFEKRYDYGYKTHGTCNFHESHPNDIARGLSEFGEKYGWHIYDRIFQMFNIVVFSGKSMRR